MFTETTTLWQYLKQVPEKPLIIYGMGDGADKILSVMEFKGLTARAFMASDEFVRGHSFRGFEVKKLSDIEREFEDFIILIAFGTNRPDVLERIYGISEKYEVYAPDVPVYGSGNLPEDLFDEKYIYENFDKIKQVREIFADEQSKEVFDRIIDYKISGKLQHLRDSASAREDALDLLGIKRDGSEVFFDFGAYDGDTAQEFIEYACDNKGDFGKIYAFEPDFRSFCKLRRRHYLLPPEKFQAINAAVWDKDGEETFSHEGGRQSALQDSPTADALKNTSRDKKIRTIKADTFCKNNGGGEIKPTLIKIDAEGCEAGAISGSAGILKRLKPKLIVSLYHRTPDLLELPLLIKGINPAYKMYLRRHECIPAWDINLYCI